MYLSNNKFGFQKCVATREAIAALRLLSEQCTDHEQDVYMCFIDMKRPLTELTG